MAKAIKFNLICDDTPIRTVDDLRNNFSIEDVLSYYDSKLLHRWLNVRGYNDLLQKVEKIQSNDPMEIIKSLIDIFEVEQDIKKVEESVYILQYMKEREELFSIYKEDKAKAISVVEDHQSGYTQLVNRIVDNSEDIAVIRATINEIINNYYWILEKDYRGLFYKLYYKAPMALFVMLTHEKTRKIYLPQIVSVAKIKEDGTKDVERTRDVDKKYDDEELKHLMSDKSTMYELVCGLISKAETILGKNLHTFASVTDSYWKDIETKDNRYMIIKMEQGNYVRSVGKAKEEFGYNDVLNKFIILDGIDYKSNNAKHKLLYMEV